MSMRPYSLKGSCNHSALYLFDFFSTKIGFIKNSKELERKLFIGCFRRKDILRSVNELPREIRRRCVAKMFSSLVFYGWD